jgi:hypothetical protein
VNSRATLASGVTLFRVLASSGPALAEPAELPALERKWQSCVREVYDWQPEHGIRPSRRRNSLDECKPHEDAYVVAPMAARPDADLPFNDLAQTWAAYVVYVVGPVKACTDALRR